MASADVTGRTKREKMVKANPFLEHFTVADLKYWADRKMTEPGAHRDRSACGQWKIIPLGEQVLSLRLPRYA